ncbi:lytic transglycosylase domain-containing protein [Micromonospora cremea]|uniref:lytic transglycosylase domain-containing protein n=1 Tax=Micromonospora cremea TaxID=709881 RepID=UPI0009417D8D|nr:lytic transglycosylase domain-containing protein [Micromonospora cremea]
MVDGEDKTRVQPLRPAAPLDGPLEGSGAAPDSVPRAVPRPRRPWLSGKATGAPNPPTETASAPSTAPDPAAASPAGAPAAATPAGTPKADAPAAGTRADAPAGDSTAPSPATGSDAATTPGGPDVGTRAGDAKPAPVADAAAAGQAASTVDGTASAPKSDPGRRRRIPFAHALRLPPRQAAVTAARATRAWARRPSGRLTLPGVFLLALVAATAAAGALLVPAAIRAPRPVAVDASVTPTAAVPPPVLPSGVPTGPLPTGPLPTGGLPTGPAGGPVIGGRPSDALAGWAQQVGAKVGVPPTAMQAYGYAELVLAQTNRSCALSWTTLAAIGQVESGHGAANGARLGQDGKALPQIIGLPLDGRDGRMRIIDTDRGLLDQDTSFDRAIGPMQFIPTTWQEIGADADNDGVKDPHDLDDAALAAGNYLCKNSRNLSIPGDWWNAILSYNDVRRYAQDIYDTANRYGRASHT